MKAFTLVSLVMITLLLASSPAPAQTFRAQITGAVMDEGGGVIPGVEVKAINAATGISRSSLTNDAGLYRILNLEPGPYRVEAELAGFKKFVREPITLRVSDIVRLDIQLQVGEISETVTVSAEAPLLEAETASFGQVVNERSIRELPLNTRDPLSLIALTPGVVIGGLFGGGGKDPGRNFFKADFRVGGGRAEGQEVLLDGAPNTTGDRSFVAYIPPVDSTQEFKVDANSFSAEFGRTSGGVINIVTKSGTNEFHGAAYEFHRNSVLDANDFFANRAGRDKISFRRHQFGFNAGGPIFKDRTFFFGDFEGLRQASPSTLISTVPTPLQRKGDFSQTFTRDGKLITIYDPATLKKGGDGKFTRSFFPGNIIPSGRFDPVATAVLKFYPEPNLPGDPVTGANNYISAGNTTIDTDKYDLRFDHLFGQANKIFGRYSFQESTRQNPKRWENPSALEAGTVIDKYYNVTVVDTHTFAPTLTGELRLSFARAHAEQLALSSGFDLKQLNFPQNYIDVAAPFFPNFGIADTTGLGNDFFNNQPRNTYSLQGNVSKLWGRHSFKFGFDTRVLDFHALQNTQATGTFNFGRLFTQGPDPLRANPNAGFGLASFLLGTGTGGVIDHINGLSLRRLYYAFYFQDDWKITPNFTLNWGLRYDLTTGQSERYHRLATMDLSAPSPLAGKVNLPLKGALQYLGDGNPRNQIDTDKNNFGPRLGLAYQLADRTVVRAGYGIFYVPMVVLALGSIGFNSSTPWVATIDSLNPENLLRNPFPQGFNLPTASRDPLTNVGFGIDGYIRDEPVGYTQQWNLSLQQQFGSDFLLDLAYWGNKGTKLQFGDGFQENFLPNKFLELGTALNARVPNPFFGIIKTGPLSGSTVTRRQLLLPFPQYTSVFRSLPMAASSIYHAFTLKAERRFSSGLSFLASYTLSKSIDDNSSQEGWLDHAGGILNMENRAAERSVSAFDIPQRLVLSYVYDLPVGKGKAVGGNLNPVLDAVVGGWTFAGIATFQNGLPIVVTRPSVNNGQSARLDGPTIERWFDTSVFSPAAPFTFGDVGRLLPDVRRDGVTNFDFTVSKNFYIGEKFRLQFRSEFFNAFNTPQFGPPVGGVTSSAFGRVTSQANTAREIQFALKLHW